MAGKAHRYGPPAVYFDCAKPVSSMSTVVLLKIEVVEDDEEKLKAWPVKRLTELTVDGILADDRSVDDDMSVDHVLVDEDSSVEDDISAADYVAVNDTFR